MGRHTLSLKIRRTLSSSFKNGRLACPVIALAVWVLCVSCTIIYSYSPPKPSIGPRTAEAIGYAVHNHYRDASPRAAERRRLFIGAVKQALEDSGYDNLVLIEDEVATRNARLRLVVDVEELSIFYDYGHAAAPQEWLTGLSLGLIPSWATRHELKIMFELFDDETRVRRWEYMTKSLWINHLIFFPIAVLHMDIKSDYRRQAAQLGAATRYFMGT